MKQHFLTSVLLCLAICPALGNGAEPADVGSNTAIAGSDPISAPASLQSVMVYRSGAELSHTAAVSLPLGNVTLAIDGLSTNIDMNTVQIKVPPAVTLLGISYLSNYLALQPKSARQKILEDSLNHLSESQEVAELEFTNTADLLDVLNKNRELKGTQTGMNVADLQKLMDYYEAKAGALTEQQYRLKKKEAGIEDQIKRLKAQIEEESTKNARESGRLLLQLLVSKAGDCEFSLSYITHMAGWTPEYELRATDGKDSILVACKASVQQTTGLDWKQVKLALSTSEPSSWSEAPVLNPWFITFQPVAGISGYAAPADSRVELRGASSNGSPDPIFVVDGQVWTKAARDHLNPRDIASINIVKGGEATALYGSQAEGGAVVIMLKKDLSQYTSVDQQQLNTVYTIDVPYDLPSTGKDQTVALQNKEVPALFTYLTVPKISDDVYLLADIPDWGKLNLLPGKANILMDGTYVGVTTMDPNSTGDTLHLTLGKDKRITIRREQLSDYSSEKFLNANHFQRFGYEISVRNNKGNDVKLSVEDQIPLSTSKDIEVTLNDSDSGALDATSGQLKWILDLKSGESRQLRFGYTLKYPKDQRLATR